MDLKLLVFFSVLKKETEDCVLWILSILKSKQGKAHVSWFCQLFWIRNFKKRNENVSHCMRLWSWVGFFPKYFLVTCLSRLISKDQFCLICLFVPPSASPCRCPSICLPVYHRWKQKIYNCICCKIPKENIILLLSTVGWLRMATFFLLSLCVFMSS